MDFLSLISAFGFGSPSIPTPPPPVQATPPPVVEQEEAKTRKARLAKISARKRGRQSLISSGSAAGDTSAAPSFAPTLTGDLQNKQTLG